MKLIEKIAMSAWLIGTFIASACGFAVAVPYWAEIGVPYQFRDAMLLIILVAFPVAVIGLVALLLLPKGDKK